MINYSQTIQKIIASITNFSFEFDFEEVKSKMELCEISNEEIEKLGKDKAIKNFENGTFKIKLSDGKIIDFNSIYQHCKENNIKEPVLFLNPSFKYVSWRLKENFAKNQIKREIKNQLSSNSEINLEKAQKVLIEEEIKNQKIVAYINELPIKTSNFIKEGKFYVNSSCTKEAAYNLINEVIEELKSEKIYYVNEKIKRDRLIACAYLFFILIVISWWCFSSQNLKTPQWLSISVGLFLFLVPFITSFINHSFIDSVLFIEKAKKKYEKEFNN